MPSPIDKKKLYEGKLGQYSDVMGTEPYSKTSGDPEGKSDKGTRSALEYGGGVLGAIVGAIIGAKSGDVVGTAMKGYSTGKSIGKGVGKMAGDDEGKDPGSGFGDIIGGGVVNIGGLMEKKKKGPEAQPNMEAPSNKEDANRLDAGDATSFGASSDVSAEGTNITPPSVISNYVDNNNDLSGYWDDED